MSQSTESKSKALVLKAFDTLFNIVGAVLDVVGRPDPFGGRGVLAEHWDVLQWDVLQDEAARAESKSGLPMFGDSFTD